MSPVVVIIKLLQKLSSSSSKNPPLLQETEEKSIWDETDEEFDGEDLQKYVENEIQAYLDKAPPCPPTKAIDLKWVHMVSY